MKKLSIVTVILIALGIWIGACKQERVDKAGIEAEIGHFLFFDKRLSYNNSKSCASCHDPLLAFTDGYHRSIGANGDIHKRNAPSILNIADNRYFTYADSSIHSIREQVQIPLLNRQFIELGTGLNIVEIVRKINIDPLYKKLFRSINIDSCSFDQIGYFLEAYCKGLDSRKSKFDLVKQGLTKFSEQEKKGLELFFGSILKCGSCHGGVDFDQPVSSSFVYASNGFFERDSSHVNRKFSTDWGLYEFTNREIDKAKFKIPGLRNCVITAPYMHDGSINSLDSVIRIYSEGGKGNPEAHTAVKSFRLTDNEKRNLLLFLQTLTDTSYLSSPYFHDPFIKTFRAGE